MRLVVYLEEGLDVVHLGGGCGAVREDAPRSERLRDLLDVFFHTRDVGGRRTRSYAAARAAGAVAVAPIEALTARAVGPRHVVRSTVVVAENHRPSHGSTSHIAIVVGCVLPIVGEVGLMGDRLSRPTGVVFVFFGAFLAMFGRVEAVVFHVDRS